VDVSNNATLRLPALPTLTNINLKASSGGQIFLPATTLYTSTGRGNTLQANGQGTGGQKSLIDLAATTTFHGATATGYSTIIRAINGGKVKLAGEFDGNTHWFLDGAASEIDADLVTKLVDANVDVSNNATLRLPALPTLTNINLKASSGGQIFLPAATLYTSTGRGNTLQANGQGTGGQKSLIDLAATTTFHGATATGYSTIIRAINGGKVKLAGDFDGYTHWFLDGAASEFEMHGVTSLSGAALTAANGAVWVFPAGWAPELKSGNSLSTSGDGRFVNRATLAIAGATLAINTSAFTNEGTLNPLSGGVFDFNGSFSIADPGILTGISSGRITVTGNLLGDTRNAAQFAPQAEVRFDGTAANPQHLEAMSNDLGPYEAGFVANFAYRNLTLANNAYLQLVNNANNTDSSVPEAVYVDTLVVPAGTTLDLNHLHLYARTSQIDGTILNGRVEPILPQPSATVGLDNHAPQTNDVLTASATKFGPEGRTVSLTFVWQVNGIERRTYTSDTALTDTFDLSVPGHGDRGDTITVTVTPRDGTVAGASVSDTVTVVGDDHPTVEIEAALRLVRNPAPSDHISDAGFVDYVSLASASVGSTYYAEIWLRDRGALRGIAGGTFDLAYTTDHADATAIAHGDVFRELTSGMIDDANGLVDNLGGGTFDAGAGTTQWVRLGIVTIQAASAGDVTFALGHDLSPGAENPNLAEIGAGSIDWSLVQFPDAALTVQHAPSNVQVSLVPRIEPFAADESADLPGPDRSPFWALESGAAARANHFYVEIWACSDPAHPATIRDGSVSISFDPQYAQAVAIDHGSLFTEDPIADIDNVTGVVSFGGAMPTDVQVTQAYVLLGRVEFRGNAPVDEVAHQAGPYSVNFVLADGPRAFLQADIGQVEATFQPAPPAAIKAMIYDIDDSGVVDFGDFSYFVPAFGQTVNGTEPPYKWWADFDANGIVDFGDFSYFVTAFNKDFSDPGIVLPVGGHGQSVPASAVGGEGESAAAAVLDAVPAEMEAELRIVATPVPSDHLSDASMASYSSLAAVPVGATYHAEVWLRDRQNVRGIAGGNLDLAYTLAHAEATSIEHGSVFNVLTSGTIDDVSGLVDNLGGGTFNAGAGASEWVRLGSVTFQATSAGDVTFELGHDLPDGADNLKFAEVGAGTYDWILVQFPAAPVSVRHYSLHPWCNPAQAEDVNGDGMVSPIDVLILINRLNASGGGSLPVPPPVGIYPPMYWDVDGDDKLTPSDALAVINFINRLSPAGIAAPVGEGEAEAASTIFARAVDEVLRNELPPFALLASEPPGHAPAARVAEPTAALNARSVDLEAAVRTGSGDGQELRSPLCQVSDDSIPFPKCSEKVGARDAGGSGR
jgi:hypothetical protein